MRHGMDDFWHTGAVSKVLTQATTHNLEPIEAEAYLQQHEQVDERGHLRHPIDISVDFAQLFTPDEARELAAILFRLADDAEQASD
jgi:hypothetical protein